ncbi:serine hydrolase [Acidobacteriota bacterium]
MRNGFDSIKGIFCILGIGAVFFFSTSCETRKSLTKKRITGVERSLLETVSIKETIPKKMDIMERMLYYRVPGVSLAVIDNYEIEWSKAYGINEVDTNNLVDTTTLFQVGELGLPLTALGILHFVEKGDLKLDEDSNPHSR